VKVMVLGATGFVGPAIVRRLAAMDHEALAVSRHGPIIADRGDPAAIGRLAEAEHTDAVIDLLAMAVAATAPLLSALAGRVGRYVLASSGDVYGRYDALHRKGPAVDAGGPLSEDAPLRTQPFPYRGEARRPPDDPAAWMDDYDKIPIEQALLAQTGLPGVVARLPMIYGPGDRQRRFAWAIGPMAAGQASLEVDAAWAAWRTSYGYVDDVAEGLALCAVHPAAAGQVYNVGPLAAPDHTAWAHRIAAVMGWSGDIRTVEGAWAARLAGLDLGHPMVTDTRRIRGELGYAEVTDADEALARTITDELSLAA
jgi:nucleoside-diphosphate-sugar epimerase